MRRSALLLVLLLLVASCGDDDAPVAPDEGATSTSVGGAPGTTATTGNGGDEPVPTTPEGEPVTTAAPAAASDTGGPPGSAAPFFLRPSPAGSLVVEISANDGAEPRRGTVQHVTSTLGEVSGKPVATAEGGSLPERDVWTSAELRAAADAATVVGQGERGVMRLLFVRGRFAESDSSLGVAVRADVAAVFVDAVARAASPLIGPESIETAVTMHEVGHLLGLVDLYLDTGRADPEHAGHSTNADSVMYWAVESTLVTDLLTGGPPRELDDADLADLAAIRNGA